MREHSEIGVILFYQNSITFSIAFFAFDLTSVVTLQNARKNVVVPVDKPGKM